MFPLQKMTCRKRSMFARSWSGGGGSGGDSELMANLDPLASAIVVGGTSYMIGTAIASAIVASQPNPYALANNAISARLYNLERDVAISEKDINDLKYQMYILLEKKYEESCGIASRSEKAPSIEAAEAGDTIL